MPASVVLSRREELFERLAQIIGHLHPAQCAFRLDAPVKAFRHVDGEPLHALAWHTGPYPGLPAGAGLAHFSVRSMVHASPDAISETNIIVICALNGPQSRRDRPSHCRREGS